MGDSSFSWRLADHPRLPKGRTVAVVVLDGWGEAGPDRYNCIHVAETPTMDSLKKRNASCLAMPPMPFAVMLNDGRFANAPDKWRLIKAHGTAVGLPTDDDMGNSEVGHNALGAGRIYAQGAKLVDIALASGKIFEGKGFKYIKECFDKGTLHLIGLLSDGGVHSRLDQLQLLLKEALENDLSKLREKGVDAQIASGGGRMYVTMDRYENDWDVVKRGWDAHVLGEAPYKFRSAVEALKKLREDPNANDQYLPPFVIVDEHGKPVGPIVDGDAVVTFNFRADRMLQYDGELKLPSHYLVAPPEIERTSGEYLVHNGIRIFACSETVKFGHVTFFWNGNRSGCFDPSMEEYTEVPSDIGIAFNLQPKMKASEIAEKAREAIHSHKYNQVRVNIPNGDMVGHTGDIEATVIGCKAADEAVKMIIDAVEQVGGIYIITADHGNAEDMVKRNKNGRPLLDKKGNIQILTSHTLNHVPIAMGGPGLEPGVRFRMDIPDAGLANVAATVMNLHGFEAPSDYELTLIEVIDG
ncbi:hypothetical protein Taro_046641 [Colocasia esculenta]|uniref:phosphoglycerate mutase (2,3-diphosphoglycerate-independent) n=1 Tax=Colocasia esculenta TaxID=4460 RepID=A0A843X6D7_COLES|nr:hypothetical protein [Colocasia esculenta]